MSTSYLQAVGGALKYFLLTHVGGCQQRIHSYQYYPRYLMPRESGSQNTL